MHVVTRVLTEHYETCLAAHGPTPEGMDWGADEPRLTNRFATVCRAIGLADHARPVSVLDVGCGCGLLLDHFDRFHPGRVRYTGLDASPAMIEAARSRRPDAAWNAGDVLDQTAGPAAFDWVVANGLITERRGIPESEMLDFARGAVTSMFRRCEVGIVFNVLSDHVNYRDEHLFYWGPAETIAFAIETLSRHVTIHHDLTTYDYFVTVRRAPWTSSDE